MSSFVVGITGASGSVLALRLVHTLLEGGHTVHLTTSRAGRMVIEDELGRERGVRGLLPGVAHENLHEWGERDYSAPFASGSSDVAGMAIVPASGSTIASVARGIADNLLKRGAEVMLKERRPLVLVPRETPLSVVHLENLLRAAQAGAVILPPVLTFYQDPGPEVSAQVDFVVSRVLDQLGIENRLYRRWGSP